MRTIVVAAIAFTSSSAIAAPVERRLHADRADASSYLWNERIAYAQNYHPNFAADDDPATAWVTSGGAGAWIRLHVMSVAETTRVRVRVRSGCPIGRESPRAKQVRVRLMPTKTEKPFTLPDVAGWQELVIEQPSWYLSEIELAIDSVYAGTTSTDLCITDLQVFATSETPPDPVLDSVYRDNLAEWRTTRRATAAALADGAATLPLYAAYLTKAVLTKVGSGWSRGELIGTATAEPVFAKEWSLALAIAAAVDARPDSLRRVQFSTTGHTPVPAVDGIEIPTVHQLMIDGRALDSDAIRLPMHGTIDVLFSDRVLLADTDDGPTLREFRADRGPCGRDVYWASRTAKLQTLVIGRCQRLETRHNAWNARTIEVLVYDTTGLLALVVTMGSLEAYRWTTDRGRPMLLGGRSILSDGYILETARR